RVQKPILVRSMQGSSIEDFFAQSQIMSVQRHGPFVKFDLGTNKHMVVHPMLAGRFSIDRAFRKALCLEVVTTRGVLGYHDDKQMGKVYLATETDLDLIPKFRGQGVDVLSNEFTEEYFIEAMGKTRRQVRVFLMDQEIIS